MMRLLKELIEIRKELQNIRAILEFQYAPKYQTVREEVDGKIVKIRTSLEDPLEPLRKAAGIRQ